MPMDVREHRGGMFRSNRLDQQRSSYGVVLAIFASFAVVGWLWFLFRSGFLDVASVEAGELAMLDRGEVSKEVDRFLNEQTWRPWHKTNLLMLDHEALSKALRERLFVDSVAVEKSYPNILRLKIIERQRSVVIVSDDRYYTVDASGIVTGPADGELLQSSRDIVAAKSFADDAHVPVIVMNAASSSLQTGFQLASTDQVRRWLDIFRAMVNARMNVRFMKIEAPESSTARFVSQRGYDIYVDLSKSIQSQITTYQQFMKTKPDENLVKEYLDIRIMGKVFVK